MDTTWTLKESSPAYGMPKPENLSGVPDQYHVLHGISWQQYEALLGIFGDKAGLRLTYCEGTLELMSPSWNHEYIKKSLARLIEVYALDRGIELEAYGSTTFRDEATKRGGEPDECYVLGRRLKNRPDIACEITLTSGSIDKLDVYRGLGIPEVWFWKQGRVRVFRLGSEGYVERERSELLPDLDLEALGRFVEMNSQTQAVRAWRDLLGRQKR
ncbi:MAG TPA: Uma2 family endonuclease [Polyangia bacterium]|jgi:Uma2 family endonuclease|nr:Uma2 family endonuclease [Polyangia bacterium]